MNARPIERRSVIPCGGALEVARLDLVVHVPRRWTGRWAAEAVLRAAGLPGSLGLGS